jgi:NAD(P)-dependent dehydrogenase (short-subunit alcohol dehydrogenase family)
MATHDDHREVDTMEIEQTDKAKAVLITGGSRGLGAALALTLGKEGAAVALLSRGAQELERTVQSLREAGVVAHGIVGDIADKGDVHRIAALAAQAVGPIDLLVHNASTLGPLPMPLVLDTECEALAEVFETNVLGPFRLTRIVAANMLLRGRGRIVLVSSDAATNAYPRWGAYGASKAAADHLHHVLAAELLGAGVRVLSVDPGEMDTAMWRAAMPGADPTGLASPLAVAARIVALLQAPQSAPYARVAVGGQS